MFFGCFLFAAWAFYRMKRDQVEVLDPELRRMMPYIAGDAGRLVHRHGDAVARAMFRRLT